MMTGILYLVTCTFFVELHCMPPLVLKSSVIVNTTGTVYGTVVNVTCTTQVTDDVTSSVSTCGSDGA